MKIRAKGIKWKSLFKLFFVSLVIPIGVATVLASFQALITNESLNDDALTGPIGALKIVIFSPLYLVFVSFVFSIFFGFGLGLYAMFRKIEIEFVDAEIIEDENKSSIQPQPTSSLE